MTVYRITKWSETFETCESRKHLTLLWVSVPTGFASNGYARLIEDWADEAPQLYGAWIVLANVASDCPVRGMLSTSSGEGLSAGRLAFITHFPKSLFEKLLPWAESVGWLEVVDDSEVIPLITARQIEVKEMRKKRRRSSEPAESVSEPVEMVSEPVSGQVSTGLHNITSPNLTQQNSTSLNRTCTGTEPAQPESGPVIDGRMDEDVLSLLEGIGGADVSTVRLHADRLLRHFPTVDPKVVWQVAWVTTSVDSGLTGDMIAAKSKMSNPTRFMLKSIDNACVKAGLRWDEVRRRVPDPPKLVQRVG